VTSWSFPTNHARVPLCIARDPRRAAPRHRGQPEHQRAQRPRHRHRPDHSRLPGEAERRPPQPLPDPGTPPAARTRQPGTRHRRRPRPPRGRLRENAADRDRTSPRPPQLSVPACTRPTAGRRAARPASSDQRSAMDQDTGVLPGPGLSSNEPRRPYHRRAQRRTRHRIRPLSREQLPPIAPPAASRLVIDLSRVSCRDASGLAVLTGTGRRAPAGQALTHHRPGPADRHLLSLSRPLSPSWQLAGAGLPAERAPPRARALPCTGQTWPAGG
jgi:hypothetical protein